ncbi:Sigma-70 family RNA polymerase sigma factor, partial [Dysosmobacter welbionis]
SAPPEGGESRLHDNGQRPSAPKGDASQRGCSRASDAVPSVPPCTDRRLSETGRGIAFSPSSHFGRWEE